jgi:hypothetical protein
MRVLKQYENENGNTVFIIETGEKRNTYYEYITYYGNVLRQNEIVSRFVYTKKHLFGRYNDYRGCKLWFEYDNTKRYTLKKIKKADEYLYLHLIL